MFPLKMCVCFVLYYLNRRSFVPSVFSDLILGC